MTESKLAKLLLIHNGDLNSWIGNQVGDLGFNYHGDYLDIEPAYVKEEWDHQEEYFLMEGYTKNDIQYNNWQDAYADNIDDYADKKSFQILATFFDDSTLLLPYVVKYIKDIV